MYALFFENFRESYAPDVPTMTTGELIEFLQEFDEDTPIFISNDNGYTYGGIKESRFELRETEE